MICHAKRTCVSLICAALLAVGFGCSGDTTDRPEVVPVSGTVVYKNQPVEGAVVAFWGEGQPKPAQGTTDAEGKFDLSTFEFKDGAVPGEHKITVSKVEAGATAPATDPTAMMNDPAKLAQMSAQGTGGDDAGPKHLVPAKYESTKTTPLKETVTESGPNQFILTLTD